jgi:hypothetical protein
LLEEERRDKRNDFSLLGKRGWIAEIELGSGAARWELTTCLISACKLSPSSLRSLNPKAYVIGYMISKE